MKLRFLLPLIVTGACAKAPPPEMPDIPVEVPEIWTTADELRAGIDPEWWSAFGDGGLDRVMSEAIENNYDLAIAASRLAQAAAEAKVAAADLYPQVQANLNGARRKQNFIGFPIPGAEDRVLSTTVTNVGLSVQASWEIDLWGRLSAQARASLANYQASAADLDGVRLSIAGQTARAWFGAAEASEQLRLARATEQSFRASNEQVRERYETGIRPSLDYRLSLANLAATEANLQTRRQQLDLAKRQLEIILGRYPGAEISTPSGLLAVPPEIPAGVPSELVARRPDLAAFERRLASSGELVSVARAARYPRVSLTASGGTATKSFMDLIDGDFGVWSLVGNLLQPVFEGGRIRANIDRTESVEEESLSAYVRAVLNAYLEVESALAAEAFLLERERALTVASEQSAAAESLADERYRNGLDDYVTVLESQRRAFDAESALISVRRLRLDNRVDLYLALGGGFDRDSHPELAPELADREDR